VARMTFIFALMVVALAVSSSAQAQTVHPEELLNDATQLLGTLTTGQSAGGSQIATLKQDFADFASAYLAGPVPPATGTPGAVGTSGRPDANGDWRAKYQRVESDLTTLLGPVGGAPSPLAAQLDPGIRKRLEDVRSRLQTFYAATLGQANGNPVAHTGVAQPGAANAPAAAPPVAPTAEAPQTPAQPPAAPGTASPPQPNGAPPPQIDTQWGSALALLDRMQRILDDAIKQPGKISLDRAGIDEMRAEVAQIRAMLRGPIKN